MKINDFVIYLIVLVIVLLSFKVPELILKSQEDNMEVSYYWEQKESKVDFEVRKYLFSKSIALYN